MKKLSLIIFLFLNIISVKAYENDYFSIDIPDEYNLSVNEERLYKWSHDNKYISITISDNINDYTVEKYTSEDIENQKKYIEDSINNNLNEYDTKVQVTHMDKVKFKDNLYSLNYIIYWPTKEQTGYDIYQFGSVISTDNYMYTVVYNSDSENTNEKFNSILSSFSPKDSLTNDKETNQNFLIFLMILIALFFTVLRLISKYLKKKELDKNEI